MQFPFSLYVGLRFSRARKRTGLLSFVSSISMLGVMLGVAILIVALAVMNGSISFLRGEALKSVAHVTVMGPTMSNDWRSFIKPYGQIQGVVGIAPFTTLEAIITVAGETQFVQMRGVEPELELSVAGNASPRAREMLLALRDYPNGVVLDSRLAARLSSRSGDEMTVAALDRLLRRSKSAPQALQVIGYADFGAYGGGDIILVNRELAVDLAPEAENTALRLSLEDVFAADAVATSIANINRDLGQSSMEVETWREAQASLFSALAMEKFLTGLMLMTIVAVGAVNIVSTLVMAVAEKGPDIAILRTMGASRGRILRLFIVQGGVSGVVGTFLGALLGSLIALNLTRISLIIESFVGWLSGTDNIVFLSHLQTQLFWPEVAIVCTVALLISLLATLYPAYKASKIEPAEVLRYE